MATTRTTVLVKDYRLTASNGRYIRLATKVVFPDGHEVKFMERLSRREALGQVTQLPVGGRF